MSVSTLSKVAHAAGVSLATASRVLNGSSRKPGQDITIRVRKAAETLGYVPNAQAQGLAKATSGLIGLIVHDIADPYFSTIARGVQEEARAQKKIVLLAATDGTPAEERAAVATFAAHRVDSIVIAGSRSDRPKDSDDNAQLAAELDRYCLNGGRVGVIGHHVIGARASDGYNLISLPNEELAAGLAKQLAVGPPKEFVIFAGPHGLLVSDDRVRGFQRGLEATGITNPRLIRGAFDRSGGYKAALDLARHLKQSPKTDAQRRRLCILAGNDVMAVGAAAALTSKGIKIPHEVSVAGFDGIALLRGFRPALSTVSLPLELIGRLAAAEPTQGQRPSIQGAILLSHSV